MAVRINKDDFEEKVLKSDLPVIVDFYSDSCIACKKLAPALGDVEDDYEGKLYVYKVNTNFDKELAKEYHVPILPVDSEHSAIFQSLQGNECNRIEKILLTASGGPFRGKNAEDLAEMKVEDALKHPNWSMGRKITIDSSTLVNKGLEVMEAKWLFGVELDQIEVVVQPQSVIHSMVEFKDGGIIAQLGTPDMRLPIQYALYYPERRKMSGKRLDLFELGSLTFERPDTKTFRGLALAYDAMRKGGSQPTVFNAANERAVAMFLDRRISYPQITEIIEDCMEHVAYISDPTLDQVLETEQAVYEYIGQKWA